MLEIRVGQCQEGADMTKQILSELRTKGYRITPQRRLLIEILLESTKALTAAEVWQLVRIRYADISLDTVYRNLNVLTDIGIIIPITGNGKDGARYELLSSAKHHHHIVCVKCGVAQCLDYCPIDPQFLMLLYSHGYQLLRHNIELYGVCAACDGR
jgi:Fe2+ or Zn2+ uptake regulation protein